MIELDTNIILRYLVADDESLYAKSKKLIDEGNKFYVSTLVFSEVIYALQSLYEQTRKDIWEALQVLFTSKFILENSFELRLAIDFFLVSHELSFVDCFLRASLLQKQHPIATFDKDLIKSLKHTNDFHFDGKIDLSMNYFDQAQS